MLSSNLREFSDAYIVLKGRIRVKVTNNAKGRIKKLTIKSNVSFRFCISKINKTFIDNAEDLDISMLL